MAERGWETVQPYKKHSPLLLQPGTADNKLLVTASDSSRSKRRGVVPVLVIVVVVA